MNKITWGVLISLLLLPATTLGDATQAPIAPQIIIDVNKETHTLTLTKNEITYSYDIIIGKKYTKTPNFETNFDTIDINPTWYPSKKLQKRLIKKPKIMKKDGIVISKSGILYSPPGKDNPLGKARLNLQYRLPYKIHGTNEPELFKTKNRDYSLGCIRVLEIQDLVDKIYDKPIDWNRSYTIKLSRPVHVIVH